MSLLRRYKASDDGGVSVETSLVITVIILVTAGVLEAGLAYWQWNSAQQAARHGARLAATSDPVATDLKVMTGLGGGIEAGDPFPDYVRNCSGAFNSCDQGGFDLKALQAIIYGPDEDEVCGATIRERRGICDVVDNIRPQNVTISYSNSGMGRAGSPPILAPLITVTVKDLDFDLVFLDALLPFEFPKIPPVSVSVMGEDLRG